VTGPVLPKAVLEGDFVSSELAELALALPSSCPAAGGNYAPIGEGLCRGAHRFQERLGFRR
jgi:hypothetical protein